MARYEQHGSVNVWWFPKEFSQSRFGEYHHSGQHSCTLISLLLADKISKLSEGLHRRSDDLPSHAIEIFGNAINDGNSVYDRAITIKPGEIRNLNIPDALKTLTDQVHLNFRLQEWFFTHMQVNNSRENHKHMVAIRLSKVFTGGLELYLKPKVRNHSRYLFAALIADSRTVVFTFDIVTKVIGFFDSHQHGKSAGAVIAQCSLDRIYEMAYWFVHMQQEVYGSQPLLYEVSFLTPEANQLPQPVRLDVLLEKCD